MDNESSILYRPSYIPKTKTIFILEHRVRTPFLDKEQRIKIHFKIIKSFAEILFLFKKIYKRRKMYAISNIKNIDFSKI